MKLRDSKPPAPSLFRSALAPAGGLVSAAALAPAVSLALAATLATAAAPTVAAPLSAQEPDTAAAADSSFGFDDAIGVVRVDDPRISPDGSRLLYSRSELDWGENDRQSRIRMVRADGSDARPYTAGESDRNPRWSPDGRWIAFSRPADREGDSDENRQLFLLRTDGGEARQLTEHATDVSRFEWMPGSDGLVFAAADSLTDEEERAREKGADAVFVNEGASGQTRGRWSNLWYVAADPDSGEARPVTEGERRIGEFEIAPDGRRVAFTFRTEAHRNDQFRSEIALVELASGEIETLTDNQAPESSLRWSPDGGTLTFVAPDLEEWRLAQGNLYALRPESGEVRRLAADFEGDIAEYEWGPRGERVLLAALERTDANLYVLDVERDRVRRLSCLTGTIRSPSFSADASRVAFERSDPRVPGDLYTAAIGDLLASGTEVHCGADGRPELEPAARGGAAPAVGERADGEGLSPVRVTDANPWVRERRLAMPELVRWRSEDGLEVEGLLYRPTDGRRNGSDGPGAFILEIHGGPAGVFTRSFDPEAQILTAHGYAVLQPNVRGSSGYGDELLRGNMNDIGGGDYEDLMTGVDAVIERGVAHPDSLGVKGWSYGGILGGWTITQTDRFRAASLGAMVSDWPSEFGQGFHFDVVRWYLGGDPWSNAELWRERSPYTHADRVETPTILFHGDRDRTDTMGQSMNFHQALRFFDVPTRFIRFPREGHGIREPRHHRTRLVEEMRWFQQHIRGDEDWEPPPPPEPEEDEEEDEEEEGEDDDPSDDEVPPS